MPTPIEDLLVRLINHRVSDEHARWEDYLTECFVHLLEHDEDLQRSLLGPGGLVFSSQHVGRGPKPGEVLSFSTQVSMDRHSRPDVHIEGDEGFLLLVECKAGAPYDAGQIRRYVGLASKRERGSVVAIVPRRSRPVDPDVDSPAFLGIVEWEQVAEVLQALPEPGDALALLRASLVQLLDRYGLIPLDCEVPWERQEGAEGVESVRRLCQVLDGEAKLVAANDDLMAMAPRFYRPDGERWKLATGQPTIQGKGASPRKVLAHGVGLHPAIGYFGHLVFQVGFLPFSYGPNSVPTVTLILDLARIVDSYQRSASKFLRQYLQAGGLLEDEKLEIDEHRAMELWERATRRGCRLMRRVAGHPSMREFVDEEHSDVCVVGMQVWLSLAPTTALLGSGPADPTQVAHIYREWLEASLTAYLDSDPTELFARFVAEATMPSIGRF
jgi:hypothetical protein